MSRLLEPLSETNWDRRARGAKSASRHKGEVSGMQAGGLLPSGEAMEQMIEGIQDKPCPSKDEEIKMGIFVLGRRQGYTKSEIVRRG